MLCFLVTDIAVKPNALDSALRTAVNMSFNRLSVDNDMSTNDTVLAMANGVLGNRPILRRSADYNKFESALTALSTELSRMIARDGEGATKVIDINVKGAGTESDAEKVCRAIANSMLVKTALYGEDPNWGRILSAIGYSGADVDENRITIHMNGLKLFKNGKGISKDRVKIGLLSGKDVKILIDLGLGNKTSGFITSDLTEKYVHINAHYET
jgi:glutamate N-acetyltransferase/amino-acid N-acetyltransferase